MHGMRHFGFEERWAAGRHWRGRGFGFGGRRGMMGGGDMMRAGRVLAQGDLRLIALALIAEQPRHGYEIIKVLEEKTGDWYSPSPGIVYPTLTYLEEAGYVTAQADGAKKLYTITDDGRAHLQANRELATALLAALNAVGERVNRMRGRDEGEAERGPSVPPLVRAALLNLREAAASRLEGDVDAEAKVVEVLARAAAEIKRA
jgi:DNA-binding PadR family transcriptional regulator